MKRFGRTIDTFPWYRHYDLADAGIHSTPADLAHFIRTLFSTDALLSKRIGAVMTDVPASVASASEYGIGIYVQHNPWGFGLRWYTHDGMDPGYHADMMYLPDFDVAIVLLANGSMGEATQIYEELITAVVDTVLDRGVSN